MHLLKEWYEIIGRPARRLPGVKVRSLTTDIPGSCQLITRSLATGAAEEEAYSHAKVDRRPSAEHSTRGNDLLSVQSMRALVGLPENRRLAVRRHVLLEQSRVHDVGHTVVVRPSLDQQYGEVWVGFGESARYGAACCASCVIFLASNAANGTVMRTSSNNDIDFL